MSQDEETAEYVQRYLREVKGQHFTIDEILSRPRWKREWFKFKAMEHYDGYEPNMTMKECKAIYGDD